MKIKEKLDIEVTPDLTLRFSDGRMAFIKYSNMMWGGTPTALELSMDEMQSVIEAVQMVRLTKNGFEPTQRLENTSSIQLNTTGTVDKRVIQELRDRLTGSHQVYDEYKEGEEDDED